MVAAGPQLAGCPVFRADDWWNTRVDDLPVHPRSRDWLRHMSPRSDLHPDFGPSFGDSPVPYGIPITVVDVDHARVRVRFTYADESDQVGYPLGADTRIESGRRSGGTGTRSCSTPTAAPCTRRSGPGCASGGRGRVRCGT